MKQIQSSTRQSNPVAKNSEKFNRPETHTPKPKKKDKHKKKEIDKKLYDDD